MTARSRADRMDWRFQSSPLRWLVVLVLLAVMAALARPPRSAHSVALRTGLTIAEVEKLLAHALKSAWIDGQNHLTDMGYAELEQLKVKQTPFPLSPTREDNYCPNQLRAPVESHS